jgi:hypothetical protein
MDAIKLTQKTLHQKKNKTMYQIRAIVKRNWWYNTFDITGDIATPINKSDKILPQKLL